MIFRGCIHLYMNNKAMFNFFLKTIYSIILLSVFLSQKLFSNEKKGKNS